VEECTHVALLVRRVILDRLVLRPRPSSSRAPPREPVSAAVAIRIGAGVSCSLTNRPVARFYRRSPQIPEPAPRNYQNAVRSRENAGQRFDSAAVCKAADCGTSLYCAQERVQSACNLNRLGQTSAPTDHMAWLKLPARDSHGCNVQPRHPSLYHPFVTEIRCVLHSA
jgi:hypothetical protein